MRSGWGNSLRKLWQQLCGDTPTPTLPRKRERELTVIAEAAKQCFNDQTLITESTPMLDIPKTTEKSYAEGKILQSVADGVGVITFNNPAKRNAMSLDMWEGLGLALVELRDDPGARVVILTGAGDKAFVSGADISQFEKNRHNAEASEEYSKKSAAQRALLADYPKPIIACIRGFCLGGGMQVAMAADIRIAAEHSQFGIPAAKLGIAYGYDGLKHLVSLVGPSWARLIMYTGMKVDSAEALRIGLVDRVVPDAELWGATMEIARTISGNAPLAIQAAKITIAQVLKDADKRDMDAIKAIGTACMDSEDFREGRRAFMDKRKPKFTGK
jgi:enoyl-CoA hydratase